MKPINKVEFNTKVPYFDQKGKRDGTFDVDKKVFDGRISSGLLYNAVLMYNSNRRVGLASTKVRNEVSGGGKKPWRQKGTGRARVGSIRNPIWRGGGIVFGPHPRSFNYQIPKRAKRTALIHSLNSKLKSGAFYVIREIIVDEPKTKKFVDIMKKMNIKPSTLFCVDKRDENIILSSRNIKDLTLVMYNNLNALDVLRHNSFLITEKGIDLLTKKLKG